ncbi:MAG: molybdate ABC transporter permease subunit [Dehalococcoidia bacterium]|nr:molybdate ABC transporter permease subunit [Chloroflexota bacterium]
MLSSDEFQALRLSLQVASLGTLLGLPIALAIGWVLVKSSIRGKVVLDTLVSFPLVLPPVITGYFLLLMLGRNGPIGSFLHDAFGVDLVFTWVAAALAAGLVSLPLMVRAIEVAIAGVDPRLERAARSLGAGPLRTIATVTIPLAYRGILAAALLGFARGLGEFGATIVVAGNIPGQTQTIPLAMFTDLQAGDDGGAVRLVVLSLSLALISLSIHHVLVRRRGLLRRPWATS